jgi:cellulose biosynthesis protein BcsQ
VTALPDQQSASEERLRFIVVDCPPDLSVLTDAAFIAAQNVFLAAQTQATSRDALDDLWDQLESIEDNQQIERGCHRTSSTPKSRVNAEVDELSDPAR